MRTARHSDEKGMIGKLLVFWLVVLAILAVAGVDGGKIVWARFHVASVTSSAVTDAATKFRDTHSSAQACAAAAASISAADPTIKLVAHNSCKVDPGTGRVTITVTKHVDTLVAGRLSFTKKYTTISDTETATPPSL